MDLPRPKNTDFQDTLFPLETPITFASARNWTGDFFEEATRVATGATRYRTDCRVKVCPDLQWVPPPTKQRVDRRVFFESKAVGRTGHAIIYQNRWLKDLAWLKKTRSCMYYWFWSHKTSVMLCPNLFELRCSLARMIRTVYILPVCSLDTILQERPLRVLNTSIIRSGDNSGKRSGYGKGNELPVGAKLPYGFQSSSYGIGWSIPLTLVSKVCRSTYNLCLPISVYGHVIPQIKVSTGNEEALKFLL